MDPVITQPPTFVSFYRLLSHFAPALFIPSVCAHQKYNISRFICPAEFLETKAPTLLSLSKSQTQRILRSSNPNWNANIFLTCACAPKSRHMMLGARLENGERENTQPRLLVFNYTLNSEYLRLKYWLLAYVLNVASESTGCSRRFLAMEWWCRVAKLT
jgi:hypothetical protein